MFCENCGAKIEDGSLFCPECGARQNTAPAQPQPDYEGLSPAPELHYGGFTDLSGKLPEDGATVVLSNYTYTDPQRNNGTGASPQPNYSYTEPAAPNYGGYTAPPQPNNGGYSVPPQPDNGGYSVPPQPNYGGYTEPAQPNYGGYTVPPQPDYNGYPNPAAGPNPAPNRAPKAPKSSKGIGGLFKNKKLLIILAGGVVLLAALVVLGIIFIPKIFKRGGSAAAAPAPTIFLIEDYKDNYNQYYIAPNAPEDVVELLNDKDTEVSSNMLQYVNRASAAVVDNAGDLYLFDGKELTRLNGIDEEEFEFGSFVGNGNDFVYKYEDSMMLYQNGAGTVIGEEGMLEKNEIYTAVLSADGKYIGYVLQDDDGSLRGYVWDGKNTVELGKNDIPVGIADGGQYLYYLDISSKTNKKTLMVRKGIDSENEESLGSFTSGVTCYINRSGNEIVYSDDSGRLYLSRNGQPGTRILSTSNFGLVAGYNDYTLIPYSQSRYGVSVPMDSFIGRYYTVYDGSSTSVYYLNSNLESTRVARGVQRSFVTSDGKYLLYTDDNYSLYRVDGSNSLAEAELLVKEDCYSFVPTSDGRTIYYENEDEELLALTDGKSTRISNELDGDLSFSSLYAGKTLVYCEDGELYLSNGGKGEQVRGMDQDIYSIQCGDSFILINAKDEIFYSTDGTSFNSVYEK